MKPILILTTLLLTAPAALPADTGARVNASVTGRCVRIEAPVSARMSLHEIEVFSGGTNVARSTPDLKFAGTGYKGRDINFRNETRQLVDGAHDLTARGLAMGVANSVGPWLELDFGRALEFDKIVLWQPTTPGYADRGLRLVTVLDADRRVVFAHKFHVRDTAHIALAPVPGPLLGRQLPPNAVQWAPLGEFLEARPSPLLRDATMFAQRNSPASIARLAREFCARLDLAKPELRPVRERFERGDYAGALDAYRDHFLAKIQRIAFPHEHPRDPQQYASEADDMLRNIAVTFARDDVAAQRFTPGQIDWACPPGDDKGTLATAHAKALAGSFTRALLTAYRETGDARFLTQWAAINDDWGLNIKADLARSSHDVRDYFVKEPLQEFNHFAGELAETARRRPDFARHLPGATLARILIPVLEEYPPAYWWVCRRTAFNHTFNALNAAYTTARVLDDFHAGQRLDRENRQHWERIWTFNVTRDGSMIEIGDEGHLDMHLRIGVLFEQMLRNPPPWFTPAFRTRFLDGYFTSTRYLVRHMTPNGLGHRYGIGDHFPRLWQLSEPVCTIGNMIPRPTIDARPILNEPDVRDIVQAVFGAGSRKPRDEVVKFYGKDFAAPRTLSDWMQYAGLHYLRRSWEPDASFVHILSQATGHEEANGRNWNTEFRYWDYGWPLVHAAPVRIGGLEQNADAGRLTYAPGSKTVRLTTAPEQPINARWHTSALFDLAETFYVGAYQKEQRPALENVRAERTVIQVRPARLFIATDIVRAGRQTYELPYQFWLPGSGKVTADAVRRTLALQNGATPGVTLRHFGPGAVSYATGRGASRATRTDILPKNFELAAHTLEAEAAGNLVLVTLLEPHRRDGDNLVRSVRDLSAGPVVGFSAELANGTLTWHATEGARKLDAGPVSVTGEGLLLWQSAEETTGLLLGTTNCEFKVVNGRFTPVQPIQRPVAPVTIAPAERVFTESATVTLTSATPGTDIWYTLNDSPPKQYSEPFTITADTFIKAHAAQSPPSYGQFWKRAPLPAVTTPVVAGLRWEYVVDTWFALFSHLHLPSVVPAQTAGVTTNLLDVTMRRGDGPFGVRYSGYLDVPADGVYTFHAPPEYVGASCEPGYDLRVFVDAEEWDLGQQWHGLGRWSAPLRKGLHRFMVTFADARHRDRTVPNSGLWRGYPTPEVVWKGEVPVLEIAGPSFARQPLPDNWLFHEQEMAGK